MQVTIPSLMVSTWKSPPWQPQLDSSLFAGMTPFPRELRKWFAVLDSGHTFPRVCAFTCTCLRFSSEDRNVEPGGFLNLDKPLNLLPWKKGFSEEKKNSFRVFPKKNHSGAGWLNVWSGYGAKHRRFFLTWNSSSSINYFKSFTGVRP